VGPNTSKMVGLVEAGHFISFVRYHDW
jgi:hypothetical protein